MRKRYHIGPGAASLVMIVVILCMTVLGILTWTSARADLRLSQRDGEMVAGYYQADAHAQRLLYQVDQALYQARADAPTGQDYLSRVDGLLPPGVVRDGDRLRYSVDAGAQRAIDVVVRLTPLEEAARYKVEAWALEDKIQWEEDW